MPQTTFRHGNPLMVDYTPGSAVTAGDVVVAGQIPYVCHTDIAASKLGAMGAGGGVYEVVSDGTPDTAGALVYWVDASNKVATTGGKHFGYTLPGQGATVDGDLINVIHAPNGGQA